MSSLLRSFVLRARVPQGGKIDSLEEPLACAKQDRRDGNVHFIYEAVAKILLDHVDPSAKSHILGPGRSSRARSRATTAPSVTKLKVVPPSMTSGGLA